jgi:hypothetical protein
MNAYMPTLNFPPPADHQEFERLVADIAGPVLHTPHVQLNGRSGQAQAGVDVSVTTLDGNYVGIQCKRTDHALALSTITDEIIKARVYRPALTRFIIATTARADAQLQRAVRELPPEAFTVEVWSWDDINNHMNRLPGVGIPYAEHVLIGSAPVAEHQHAEHLREALDRPAFLRRAHAEHNFHEQQQAVRDTSSFLRTGHLYTRDGRFVSGLPYRRYGEGYETQVAKVLRAIDALDNHLGRAMRDLTDEGRPGHAGAQIELDTRRLAVLTAANRIFRKQGIAELMPSS